MYDRFGVEFSSYLIALGLLAIPYYFCFDWIEQCRTAYQEYIGSFHLDSENPDLQIRAAEPFPEIEQTRRKIKN
jgi:hypothetical protein